MPAKRSLSPLFTWRSAIAQAELPMASKAVAYALSLHMNESGGSAFPSLETLRRESGAGQKRTVIDAVRLLEAEGYLQRTIGGGRGHATVYEALVPETVQSAHRFSGQGQPSDEPVTGTGTPLGTSAKPGQGAPAAEPETVQSLHRLEPAPERVHLEAERVHSALVKGAVTAPEDVRRAKEDAAASARARLDSAAADDLSERLQGIGVGIRFRTKALEDPERAAAWLELALAEADTNPAGYWRSGFESGEWPSKRPDTAKDTRWRWIQETSWQIDVDEAHHIIDSWNDLDDVERSRLHELADDVRAEREAKPAERKADAA